MSTPFKCRNCKFINACDPSKIEEDDQMAGCGRTGDIISTSDDICGFFKKRSKQYKL